MRILIPGIPFHGELFDGSLGDLEGGAGNDEVGRVGTSGPFLTVDAVTDGCGCWGT
jgi:hypothetical protein